MKKLLTILVGLMILASLPTGLCENSKTVILVSNNPADHALAVLISNTTGWPVVVTGWGIYDTSVLTKLLSLAPQKILVIGGPLAVSQAYVKALKDLGINVTRWWGWNRYGTDLSVLKNASELGILNLKNVIVVLGNDTPAILQAEKMAVQFRIPLIYVNKSPKDIEPLLQKAENVTVFASNDTRPLVERLLWKLRKGIKMKKFINITPQVVAIMIDDAHERISAIQHIMNATNISELKKERINQELSNLEDSIRKAESLYNSGRYLKAYRLLSVILYRENRIIVELQREWWNEVQHEIKAKGDFTFTVVNSGLSALKKLGIINPLMVELLQELKQAMKEKNNEKAQTILEQLLELLRKSYGTLIVGGVPSSIASR